MKFYVTKKQKKDYTFIALVFNTGVREIFLSFDRLTILTILNATPDVLDNLAVGEKIAVQI